MPLNIQLLQVTLQALSSLAIAGGLLYTAFQFRHARKAQLVANFSKLVELQYQLRRIRVERPDLASEQDTQTLKGDREIQQYFLNLMQVSLFEIAWYAHKQGQIADEYFHSWARRMWEVSREEAFRNMIANPSTKIMHDEFELYVRKLIAAPTPPQ
jgi:nicotinic acid phosphoribosyltransferase